MVLLSREKCPSPAGMKQASVIFHSEHDLVQLLFIIILYFVFNIIG